MIEDLDMTGHDYNIALFVFFIPYILFEVPSNIIIKKLAPSTWLSIIMVLWGKSSISSRQQMSSRIRLLTNVEQELRQLDKDLSPT